MLKVHRLRLFFFFVTSCLFISCSSNVEKIKKNRRVKSNDDTVVELNNKLDNIYIYLAKNDSLVNILREQTINYQEQLSNINNKIKAVDGKIIHIDSINSNISLSLLSFEDNINLLRDTYNEISEVSSTGDIKKFPPIDDEEFKNKYLTSLTSFQNGEWEQSLKEFNYLLNTGSENSLLDNCQYWVGEIYFKMKKYHLSIKEFKKVFLYMDSNKRDDSLYKIAKCYILLKDELNANKTLDDLIQNYPNSEYVKKAKELLN